MLLNHVTLIAKRKSQIHKDNSKTNTERYRSKYGFVGGIKKL